MPSETRGDELKLIPSIALRTEFDDNIVFSRRDELDSVIFTQSPGFNITRRTERFSGDVAKTQIENLTQAGTF